jgi:UDP-glucose 4-epimerase
MIESNQPKPEDPYGIAKFAIELDLLNAYKMFGLNYIIFRPHNVYGSHQNIGDKYRNVIGIFMNQILKKEPLTIYGDGKQSRAFSFIDDVAPYIAKSVDLENARNQIFNIGSEKIFTLNELAKIVSGVMNVDLEIDYLESREEVIHAYADHEKFESVFDPDEYRSLEEGIKKMAQWVMINGSKSSRPFENVEIKKNLPENWK